MGNSESQEPSGQSDNAHSNYPQLRDLLASFSGSAIMATLEFLGCTVEKMEAPGGGSSYLVMRVLVPLVFFVL